VASYLWESRCATHRVFGDEWLPVLGAGPRAPEVVLFQFHKQDNRPDLDATRYGSDCLAVAPRARSIHYFFSARARLAAVESRAISSSFLGFCDVRGLGRLLQKCLICWTASS